MHIQSNDPQTIAYAGTKPSKYNLGLCSNPLGCSPIVTSSFDEAAKKLGYNPSGYPQLSDTLIRKLACHYGTSSSNIYIGSKGASGVIASVFESGLISKNKTLVLPKATFPMAAVIAKKLGLKTKHVMMRKDLSINFNEIEKEICRKNKQNKETAIFLCNPNNPTGIAETTETIISLAKKFPETTVIVSEANMELVNSSAYNRINGSLLDKKNYTRLPKNILVIRSFSKAYGIANDRVGYAVGAPELINTLFGNELPFALGDREAIRASLALQDQFHVHKTRRHITDEMLRIKTTLKKLGFDNISKSDSNLILAGVPFYFKDGSKELAEKLKDHNCSVVSCGSEFGNSISGKYIRLTPSTTKNNTEFLKILKKVCREERSKTCPIVYCADKYLTVSRTAQYKQKGFAVA